MFTNQETFYNFCVWSLLLFYQMVAVSIMPIYVNEKIYERNSKYDPINSFFSRSSSLK